MEADRVGLILDRTTNAVKEDAGSESKVSKANPDAENHQQDGDEETDSLLNIRDAPDSLEGQLSALQPNRNLASHNQHRHIRDPPVPPPTDMEQAREEQVQEEEDLDRAVEPHVDMPRTSRAPRGTRQVYSAIFDCLDTLNSGLARLEHHAATNVYSPDIQAPPFDRSALDNLDESDDVSDEE